MNRIKKAFDSVRAEDALKNNTAAFIAKEVARRLRKPGFRLRYAAAAALLLVGILGFGGYSYAMPASYISIDVNPSVEISVNFFNRVVAAKAYNDDGAAILEGVSLKGKTYTDAINALLSNAEFQTYLNADAMLTITVVSNRQADIIAGIKNCAGYLKYGAQCRGASADIVGDAHENGLSFGKYQSYLELSAYDPAITPQQCRFMTMKQLHDRLEQCTGGCQGGNGQGGGSGAQDGSENNQNGMQGSGQGNSGYQGGN